jgi:hypothetical protein
MGFVMSHLQFFIRHLEPGPFYLSYPALPASFVIPGLTRFICHPGLDPGSFPDK